MTVEDTDADFLWLRDDDCMDAVASTSFLTLRFFSPVLEVAEAADEACIDEEGGGMDCEVTDCELIDCESTSAALRLPDLTEEMNGVS